MLWQGNWTSINECCTIRLFINLISLYCLFVHLLCLCLVTLVCHRLLRIDCLFFVFLFWFGLVTSSFTLGTFFVFLLPFLDFLCISILFPFSLATFFFLFFRLPFRLFLFLFQGFLLLFLLLLIFSVCFHAELIPTSKHLCRLLLA